jgi:hypothetical protein
VRPILNPGSRFQGQRTCREKPRPIWEVRRTNSRSGVGLCQRQRPLLRRTDQTKGRLKDQVLMAGISHIDYDGHPMTRSLVNLERLQAFLERFGRECRGPGTVFLVGDGSAILNG